MERRKDRQRQQEDVLALPYGLPSTITDVRSETCGNVGTCHENARCADVGGGFKNCVCQDGFEGDGVSNCADIDECADGSDLCEDPATCDNIPGSYLCNCPAVGYTPDGDYACADIDECATNNGGSVVRTRRSLC